MPRYAYTARDPRGVLMEGTAEGADSRAVAGMLAASGAIPIEIRATAAPRAEARWPGRRADRIGRDAVLLFSRQMHTLLKAGVPILSALKGLQESSEDPAFARVLADVRATLDQGRELSYALGLHGAAFNPFYVSMVQVGEYTGTLEQVFLRLFHHLDFEKFMREQVRAALRYPAIVVGAMAFALVIINVFVVPAFEKIFAGFRAELPLVTRALIGFSRWTVTYWPLLLATAVALVFAWRWYRRTPEGRRRWDALKLRTPVAGRLMLKATLARFARSFSLALSSGVPAVQALSTVAATVDNAFVADRIEGMRATVERGDSILRAAAAAGFFSPMVLQMVAVGEESGALDDLMAEVADMYQRDVEYDLKRLGAQIEPILIIFLGVLVLVLALGVFLPLWDLGSVALGRKGG